LIAPLLVGIAASCEWHRLTGRRVSKTGPRASRTYPPHNARP